MNDNEITVCGWVFHNHEKPQNFESRKVRMSQLTSELRSSDVLVKITAATVCGSDVHTIEGRRVDPAAPLILGHEGVGEVTWAGTDAWSLLEQGAIQLGSRVTWSVATNCSNSCEACSEFCLPQKCSSNLKKYGHAPFYCDPPLCGFSGTYASHIVLTKGSVILPLPSKIPNNVGSSINCALATMVNGLFHSRIDGKASSVLILGAGMLGIYGVMLAKHIMGCSYVAVTDVSKERLELAMEFGADIALNVSVGEKMSDQLDQLLTNHPVRSSFKGFDMVIEACGVSSGLPLGIQALRIGGELVLLGMIHPNSALSNITAETIIRKCLILRGVHNYSPSDLTNAIDFLEKTIDVLPYHKLVSDPVPLQELPKAIELAKTGKYQRVVVTNDR
jgi:putative phosphonate catabolism associated alcohol dehydrogenase